MRLYSFIVLGLTFLHISNVLGKRDFEIRLTKFVCKRYDVNVLEEAACFMSEHNNRSYGNVYFELRKPLAKLPIRTWLNAYRPNRPRLNIYDLRLDMCSILVAASGNKFFEILLKEITRSSNMLPKCPIKAHFNFTLTDFYYNAEDYPPNVPEGSYRTGLWVFESNQKMFEVLTEAEIVYKRKNKN